MRKNRYENAEAAVKFLRSQNGMVSEPLKLNDNNWSPFVVNVNRHSLGLRVWGAVDMLKRSQHGCDVVRS